MRKGRSDWCRSIRWIDEAVEEEAQIGRRRMKQAKSKTPRAKTARGAPSFGQERTGGKSRPASLGMTMLGGREAGEMKGVEEFYARVKDGIEIVWPLESMEYVEFGVRDLDGYTLGFAERE
jgi:hypothetical protein